jgi:TolB-like protein/class 3 adenylate cyclase
MTTTRRLAAILAADVAGYSRLMAANEIGTLDALKACRREVVDPAIAAHNGRIVKTTGDGMLLEFASAVDAVTCAMSVQEKMAARGGSIAFRIGINVGDIIIDNDDIFGDGVNVAARVENECQPGGVYLSANAVEQVRNKTTFAFDDLGEKSLKNIDRPTRIYAVRLTTAASPSIALPELGKPLPLPDKPSIAVLPFQNMSGDPDQDYFADGMVEDIITALSRFKSLFVIARNSSFTYKGKAVDIKQVGRELGVRYVLEGSVRRSGGRIRITGQLIESGTNNHLWADRFEGGMDSIFDLQDEVTARVVAAIAPAVEKEEVARARRKPTDSIDAVTEYYRGVALSYTPSQQSIERALAHLRRAIEIDPGVTAPYGSACICLFFRHVSGWPADQAADHAEIRRLSQKIRETADDAAALSSAAFAVASVFGDLDAASEMSDLALRANPNLAAAHYSVGYVKALRGASDTAIADLERGMRFSPLDHRIGMGGIALAHYNAGRYEESVSWCERFLRRFPHAPQASALLIANYVNLGRSEDALKAVRNLLDRVPHFRLSMIIAPGSPFTASYRQLLLEAGLPE